MNLKHVLVMDCSEDIGRNLTFLLQLAGYRITVTKDETEAVNWITNCQNDSNRVDLLLISNVESPVEGSLMLDAITKFANTFPILIVDRGVNCRKVMKVMVEELTDNLIHMCRPDSIIDSLSDVLKKEEGLDKRMLMSV